MKSSLLGLAIAAAAFGASTIYLGVQLGEARDRSDQVLAESRALQARIDELEQMRRAFDASRPAGGGGAHTGDVRAHTGSLEAPPSPTASGPVMEPVAMADTAGTRASYPMPERSEAFRKMRRTQLRASNKRLYADVGTRLGLTREESNQLIDLLTDQQIAGMESARERMSNPDAAPGSRGDVRQKQLAEVADLIGQDKIEQFKDYQETLPARQEVEMLARQLEGADMGLTQDQRDRMVTALAEERRRVPPPVLAEAGSPEDYAQAMNDWQKDYQERATSRARSILHGEQLAAYNEYQDWSRQMRQQFEARRAARAADGNVTMAEPVMLVAPAPPPR
jgi:hypothetical protein